MMMMMAVVVNAEEEIDVGLTCKKYRGHKALELCAAICYFTLCLLLLVHYRRIELLFTMDVG